MKEPVQLVNLNPAELAPPVGFSHGVLASRPDKILFLAGQCGHDSEGRIVDPGDLVAQFDRALENHGVVLRQAGLEFWNITQLQLFVLDRADYVAKRRELGQVYRKYFGKHYPAMALFEIRSLLDRDALVEVLGVACG